MYAIILSSCSGFANLFARLGEFIPGSKIQPSMFKEWRRVMIPKLGEIGHKRRVNAEKDDYQDARSRRRLYTKLVKRNEECRRLGIHYQFRIPVDPVRSRERRPSSGFVYTGAPLGLGRSTYPKKGALDSLDFWGVSYSYFGCLHWLTCWHVMLVCLIL